MAVKQPRVTEEQMLNNMFVTLEYCNSIKEFIESIKEQERLELFSEIKRYYGD